MDFNASCNGACTPPQIINFSIAINDISTIKIYDDCGCEYSTDDLQYAYSLDNLCWSCYMSYTEALTNTIELKQDFYVRIEIKGIIGKIEINGEKISDFSTELKGCFNFSAEPQTGTYDPYANMDNAISLQQQLAESVSQLVGIPVYYIKLNPNSNSKDLTFKEYALYNVQAIKQVKIVIVDNQMPSSKPEFGDWGLDWQTDWEVEVTKGSFATAFGNFAQPMEGDLVYIPMMKRMWMVNGAYEEKKDGIMWIATTFKLALVKYQEKDSVILGDAQTFVDNIVKTKYEDLFGDDDNNTLDSGEASTSSPTYAAGTLYSVYESDATRKYITCDSVDIMDNELYQKGVLLSDKKYQFTSSNIPANIVYQKQYCGDEYVISFIVYFNLIEQFENSIVSIGDFKVMVNQEYSTIKIFLSKNNDASISIRDNTPTFITLKISKSMNLVEMFSYEYKCNEKIPIYKRNKYHYYFDIDNPADSYKGKFDIEYYIPKKENVEIHNINGWITNFKLFDIYTDNISEILQMYPNHQHLLINDTARRIVDLPGVSL